ncbi:PolC-type DNA polymerase III [Eubacterium oxidoreducens]|uniref:DNA polymerase III PolC-type n=1 Tax=Eubacterium oxidoreducens TaxID=1732 RepID=A0A1G6AP41_EUBOX|nr:PolC-type DNA polymerase III [Eubacterium oxidoreducens]SDB10129.1 DNA polymerase-3 subunit alpha [Eubacterium oxidoreducens]
MEKAFTEVFASLKLSKKMQEMFEEVTVEQLSINKSKTMFRIKISATHLIDKAAIFALEECVKEQIFKEEETQVKVYEHFVLSKQYNCKNLYEMYLESMLLELKSINRFYYLVLKKAKVSFDEEDTMHLSLEDTMMSRENANHLIAYFDKVFYDRCGLKFHCEVDYFEPAESKYKEIADRKMDIEIQQILSRTMLYQNKELEAVADDNTTKSEHKESSKQSTSTVMQKKYNGGAKKSFSFQAKKSDNPDVIYGREFEDEPVSISSIGEEPGDLTVKGKIIMVDDRELRSGKHLLTFSLTDFTDTIRAKLFLKPEQLDDIKGEISSGKFVKLKGFASMDLYDKEIMFSSIFGIMKIADFTTSREDTYPQKRVELHCHTKMSEMDAVTDVKDLINQAKKWGHKALAITDHGCVQAFTDAHHTISLEDDFKVIYGVEAYLVDDLQDIVIDENGQNFHSDFVVFDIETTGLSPLNCKIIEIGAVKISGGNIVDRFSSFVNPNQPIPFEIQNLTSITDEMVMSAPVIDEVLVKFLDFCKDCVVVAHNADFDMGFIRKNSEDLGLSCAFTVTDTMQIARLLMPDVAKFTLDNVAKKLGVSLEHHHRAVDDAECTANILLKQIAMLEDMGITNLKELNELAASSPERVKKLSTYHAIIIATNTIGRINLYRLVSMSHLKYYYRRPRIPKSEYLKYSEGLIIGSACEAGELYQALLDGKSKQEIARLVNFYDYLEIQPVGNNEFMIRGDKPRLSSIEDIKDINRQIVKLGEQFNKMVVATCDVHFMNPEDEVYRRIIMAGKGFKDADDQAPLFLRTTEEMIEELEYLGSEKAIEVVITNTNKIADMCEKITPVRPDKCPPVIENSDQLLREICNNKAHEMYGEQLPEIVQERLDRELNSIISNGYAVMYIIAQKLVWKSNEDGYLVGSRGSVGSSFVATMSGITEVNPLSPHYRCENCQYSDFDSEEVKKYAGRSGCDLPDKDCPVCGHKLVKDGFDIPFETFLGFKGNKEPDIDLNFSGDYQGKAHRYTEVIFGEGQTFRAGTIGALADKTAFGYVKKYYEEHGVSKRNCEIDRIVQGCVGIKRTTGQHPGGIVVLPMGEDMNSFTPIQHPANDMTTDVITTHFDYHSIDHNLLKLDILGHDDPTMIRMLEDLTGIDATSIPFDDKKVMSLFQDTSALEIKPDDISGVPLGSLGIPEFGTDFVIQMLIDTKPQSISDLIRISGLSHGTDVWLGNAQELIRQGNATIATAICTRDDIMTYLISMGVESEQSFTIMEAVRKGKGLKPEWEEIMKEHNVPDWYIWSCKKIKYMFPKAHAAAYVMMAWRIAYFKVYYPLAYYAAFFSIRATAFSYELMCQGKERLEYEMDKILKKEDPSKKELDTVKDMRIVQEMYARGFEFCDFDIYKAKAHYFQVIDGKLMPSISSIEGLGDKAADAVEDAAKNGEFLSRDDFRQRTKASKTVIELMVELGILSDLPETNQLSLFDFV